MDYASIILRIIGTKRIKNYSRNNSSHFGPKKNNRYILGSHE